MAAPIYKQSAPVRTAFFMAIAALFLSFPHISRAETNPNYTVEGVEVDVTAENAVKAREKALDEAQVKAYQTLAERFLSEDELKNFKVPDPVTVSSLVQDYEVTNEQLSTTRYKGTFTIRFRPSAMKSQMASEGAVIADAPRKPVLVLPIYQADSITTLWNETNPWMRAWRGLPADRSLLQTTVLPSGDAQDVAEIGDGDGLRYDPMKVQEMASRYNADEAAILVAEAQQAQGGQARVTVSMYDNGFEGPRLIQKVTVDQMPGEQADALFIRAAQKAKAALSQNWKANAAYNPAAPVTTTTVQTTTYGAPMQPAPAPSYQPPLGPSTIYSAHAVFASVQDWVRLKNTLDRVYGVQGVMIRALKPREALMDISFAGNVGALQSALSNAGITLRAGAMGQPLELYMGAASPQTSVYYQ